MTSAHVNGATHAKATLPDHLRVYLRGPYIGVTQQLLNGADVIAGFEQSSREAVAEDVTVGLLMDARCLNCPSDGSLYHLILYVMPTFYATSGIDRYPLCGEQVLPCQLARSTRIFPRQGRWHVNLAKPAQQIAMMLRLHEGFLTT